VFKVIADKPMDIHFVRVYSGTLKSGSRILNATRGKKENVSRLLRVFASVASQSMPRGRRHRGRRGFA